MLLRHTSVVTYVSRPSRSIDRMKTLDKRGTTRTRAEIYHCVANPPLSRQTWHNAYACSSLPLLCPKPSTLNSPNLLVSGRKGPEATNIHDTHTQTQPSTQGGSTSTKKKHKTHVDGKGDGVPRHHHLRPLRQLDGTRDVRRPHEELRTVVGEERRVPAALLLVEHVHLCLERLVDRD